MPQKPRPPKSRSHGCSTASQSLTFNLTSRISRGSICNNHTKHTGDARAPGLLSSVHSTLPPGSLSPSSGPWETPSQKTSTSPDGPRYWSSHPYHSSLLSFCLSASKLQSNTLLQCAHGNSQKVLCCPIKPNGRLWTLSESCGGHAENTGSLSYADLPKSDPFHCIWFTPFYHNMKKPHSLIVPPTSLAKSSGSEKLSSSQGWLQLSPILMFAFEILSFNTGNKHSQLFSSVCLRQRRPNTHVRVTSVCQSLSSAKWKKAELTTRPHKTFFLETNPNT